jgi:hypothetical protein
MDAPFGVFIDGTAVRANLQAGTAKFKNNLIAGSLFATEPGTATAIVDSLFGTGTGMFKNDSLTTTTGVLVTPYDYLNPDYRPALGGLGTQNAAFTDAAFTGLIAPCEDVNAPGTMSGASNIAACSNPQTYSIPAIANASSYYWSVPAGATIVSGQGTRTITVNFTSTLAATWTGTISVVGKNDCGNSSVAASKSLSKVTLGTPGVITAPVGFTTNVCTVVGRDTTLTYSIASVAGAVNYVWSKPSNTTIVTGANTNSITLKFNSGYTTAIAGDTLKVTVSSSCATAAVKTIAIKAALPATPAAPAATVVSGYACGARIVRYSAPALVAPATGYQWQMPSGGTLSASATLDSGVLTGRYIKIKFSSDVAASTTDSIKVAFTSACGNTANKGLKLAITALAAPAAPSAITATTVVPNICGARVVRFAAPAIPVTATTVAITGYEWFLPTGGTLSSSATLDSGVLSGATARYIKVKFASNVAASTLDSIRVRYTYACGVGAKKALKLALTALATPAAPTAITITKIADVECGRPRYRYAVPSIIAATATAGAATGYEWSFIGALGAGATIDSGSTASRVITVTYYSTDAAAVDSIKCRYTSDCGFGAFKAAKLTNTLYSTSVPAKPASIVIALASDDCGARRYRYTAPALPAASATAAAATGYIWTLPTTTLGLTATLDSGSLNSQVIIVKYASNAAAVAGDSMYLAYTSLCGTSAIKGQKLSNLVKLGCRGTEQPLTAKTTAVVTAEAMSATVYPNPNNGVFTVRIQTGITSKMNANIQVIDMNGRVVSQVNAVNENGQVVSNINNYNLSNGFYMVKYTVGNVTNVVKMIVRK